MKKLKRSITDKKLFGVCGGLGEYLDSDPTVIRILFVVMACCGWGSGILLYLVAVLLMPIDEKGE